MNARKKQLLISAFLSLALAACSSAPVKQTDSDRGTKVDYAVEKARLERSAQVSPGFTLRISHSADKSIAGEFVVSFDGNLKLPFHVVVAAGGLTISELRSRIAEAYGSYFRSNNTVSVEIVKREYLVEIRGLVTKPGRQFVKLDTSIEEIVALGGGFPGSSESKGQSQPKPEFLRIVRPGFMQNSGKAHVKWVRLSDYFSKFELEDQPLWRGGEQLFFQVTADPAALKDLRGRTVQLMGEVHKPGDYPIEPGADIYAYLALAGGPTSTADLSNVTIMHKLKGGSTSVDITSERVVEDLEAGDVILIRSMQTRPSFIERTLPILVGVTSIITSVFLILFAI